VKLAITSGTDTTILITEWNSGGTIGAGRKSTGDGGTIIGTIARISSVNFADDFCEGAVGAPVTPLLPHD
jgi:hypothetical protein